MRVAFIGNCQVESFAVAAQHMLADADISIFDYSQTYSRSEEARRRYVLGLHSTDYVFAQTATFSHTSEHDLREVLGDRLVTIANFYFRGLFPDTCYIGDFSARLDTPSTLHSVIVLDGFRRGLSEDDVCARFNSVTLDEFGLGNAWESSLAEMRAREAGGVLDVPVGELMEEACRCYPAFLTMNHPSGRLINTYLSRVFDYVGLPHRVPAEGEYPDALARHDIVPIHDFVAERHRLAYRTPQNFKINSLGGAVSREDYVAACYHAYAQHRASLLMIHSPTDMVASLRASAYRYLVDPESATAGHNLGLPAAGRRSRDQRFSAALAGALQPAETSTADISAAVHVLRARAETMDIRLDQLAGRVHQADAADNTEAAEVASRSAILASLDRLQDRVGRLHRLARLAVGLAILALAIGLADVFAH